MPNVTAACNAAVFFIVVGNVDPVEDALCCGDLIRAHDHQQVIGCKNAVLRQYVQDRMSGEKRAGKVDEVGDDAVGRVRPVRSELEAVAGFLFLGGAGFRILDSVVACAVGVVLCVRSVGDNENLDVFVEPAQNESR